MARRVTVRQPSGACFDLELPAVKSFNVLQTLKAAIAARTKIATTRQKLLVGHELLTEEILLESTAAVELLLLSSRCCCLVTHSSNAPAIWDAEAKTLLQPILLQDVTQDTMFQQACDAMYLDDGEAYILLKSGRSDPDVYRLELWRADPPSDASGPSGASGPVRRFELPPRWLNESVEGQFTADGEFVVAWSMGAILMWRTTGEAHLRAEGSPIAMALGFAVLGTTGIFNRSIFLWDYHSGQQMRELDYKERSLHQTEACVSHSGAYIALWSYDKVLEIFRKNGDCAAHWQKNFDFHVQNLAFSPDESNVLVQYRESPLQLRIIRIGRDRDSHELMAVVNVNTDAQSPQFSQFFTSVDYTADGQSFVLLQASGAMFRFKCDTLEEQLPRTEKPPKGVDVMCSGICPDYNTYFRCDRDGVVELIDLESGNLLLSSAGGPCGGYGPRV